MSTKKDFGDRLRMLREEKGLSQTQLAENLDVSRVTISYYENGERTADISFAGKAACFFGCTADYLLGLAEYRNMPDKAVFLEDMEQLKNMLAGLNNRDRVRYICYEIVWAHEMLNSIGSMYDSFTESCRTIVEMLASMASTVNKLYSDSLEHSPDEHYYENEITGLMKDAFTLIVSATGLLDTFKNEFQRKESENEALGK